MDYDNSDHGLLGLALDPRFRPGHDYVYALYTFNHKLGAPIGNPFPGVPAKAKRPPNTKTTNAPRAKTNASQWPPGQGRKVRRGEAKEAGGEADQEVLLEGWCQQSTTHSIGDLEFGPEGALFVSGGDGGIFTNADYGQYENLCGDPPGQTEIGQPLTVPDAEGGALRSQSLFRPNGEVLLNGALLRVNPETGAAWPTTPTPGIRMPTRLGSLRWGSATRSVSSSISGPAMSSSATSAPAISRRSIGSR